MHPTIIELREWSRMVEDLSEERNRLANRLRHQLWRYFPQMIDLSENWAREWMLDLWELIPTPAKARSIRPTPSLGNFSGAACVNGLRKACSPMRTEPIVVAPGVTDACVAHCQVIVARLRLMTEQMKVGMKQLDRLTAAVAELRPTDASASTMHCDPEILRSMPGVGPVVLAALLSEGYDAIRRPRSWNSSGIVGRRSRYAAERKANSSHDAACLPTSTAHRRLSLGEGGRYA
jgi:hypothetical protein